MANLHIEWTHPDIKERIIRCTIPDTASDEVLDRVLRSEVGYVRTEYGDDVAGTVRWRPDSAWRKRERAKAATA